MAGPLTNGRRRRRSEAEGNDGYSTSDSQNSNGSKRARLNGDNPSQDVLPDSYRSQQRPADNEDESACAAESHQPGSLVRVKLANFVTYTSAEFHLGPSLNMIIGPNGTGKSTLVCAICLGLGWGPQHLGRAKELGEFVKHGSREAEIEIELAAGPRHKGHNPIIRRAIKREGNKSTFFLNGRQVPQKEIHRLCREFSIQIDNLCQFLPQDRVVEFAALSPVDLLGATQRAAAPPEMVEWHEELKKYRSDQKRLLALEAHDKEHLTNLHARQNVQRADVERVQERVQLEKRIEALQLFRTLLDYETIKKRYEDAKKDKIATSNILRQRRDELEPSRRAIEEKKEYQRKVREVVSFRRRVTEASETKATDILKKLEQTQGKILDGEKEIGREKEGDKTRKSELTKVQQSISHVQNLQKQAPPEFDPAGYNERIREKTRLINALRESSEEKSSSLNDIRNQIGETAQRIKQTQAELEGLRSLAGQQTSKLAKHSPHAGKAWEWIQNNRNLFQEPVYGPPVIECSIRNPQYADAVEAVFQSNDLFCFTCTNKDDFSLLQNKLLSRDGLNLSRIALRMTTKSLHTWTAPMDAGTLRSYGLDGWLLDYVAGPEPVLSMLCESVGLHRTGVTRRSHTDEQYERLQESNIQTWIAGKYLYKITRRREYGAAGTSSRVMPLKNARFWNEQGVDTTAERELYVRINQLTDERNQLGKEYEKLKGEREELGKQRSAAEAEKNGIQEEKNRLQKALGDFNALPTKLATLEEKKRRLEHDGAQLRTRLGEIRRRCGKLTIQAGKEAVEYAESVDEIRRSHESLLEAEVLQIEAQSEVDRLMAANRRVEEELQQYERAVEEASRNVRQLKAEAERFQREWAALDTDEHAEFHKELQDSQTTRDQLEAEITSAESRLDLLSDGNPNAVREYENRAKEIEGLEKKLHDHQANLAQMQTDIDRIRAKWEPQLDALVRQISDAFSYNFEKIGCAGQVDIHKDEDFDQWAIQIHVKFREHEQLSLLDAHRQSGGERAVSTIFYLMALQSLARSPFRVVDEINQGMDPRNERMVHERMVDIACKEHTSQYFLITPKLLTGLKFHPRMKVHCIASGEYMPANYLDLDFPSLASVALRVKGRA